MKDVAVILDPAHGANVIGKCSPDGVHKEYLWSRDRIRGIRKKLESLGYEVYLTTESDNEPGLTYRKNHASGIKTKCKKLLLSLHNNASGSDGRWHSAQGFAAFTTKGITKSDVCARFIIRQIEKDFPDIKIRKYMRSDLNEDFEENFTVLIGYDYMACLIEWLFQDNIDDYFKLVDESFNKRFEDSIVKAVESINNYFSK